MFGVKMCFVPFIPGEGSFIHSLRMGNETLEIARGRNHNMTKDFSTLMMEQACAEARFPIAAVYHVHVRQINKYWI